MVGKRLVRITGAMLLVGLCPLTVASMGRAEILTGTLTGGQAFTDGGVYQTLTDPIGTIANNPFEDDDVRAFDEVQDLLLTGNLILDDVAAGLSSNVLGPGSTVSSHYVLFDPASQKDAIGSVTFDEPVLGIIRSNARFDDTDALLGNATATYSIGNQQLESADTVTISGSSIDFDLSSNSPGDAIRIVTGVNPVPGINVCAPGSTTLTGIATGGSAMAAGGIFKQICDPIGNVGDDNFEAPDLFAFEEQQAVPLEQDLFLDDTNFIAMGNTVSSFYAVFDPSPNQRMIATVTFPDTIIGVIADEPQLLASDFLGNASANYLNPNLRGLEGSDSFTIAGSDLMIDFTASTPGDSVRVILGSASPSLTYNVCDPQDTTLTGAVTGGGSATAGGVFAQLCEPIGPVGNDNLQANDLFAFEERQNFRLTQPLVVDAPTPTSLPVDALVSSYYVAFDPGTSKRLIGSVEFPGTILGVMTDEPSLTASDYLGNPTGIYLNPNLRGLEPGVDSISVSGNTLSVDFTANSPGDYVRVIVQGAPMVPSVAPLGLLVLAGSLAFLGAVASSRRR